jgi:spoIIIJ-associated protein
VKSYDAQAKNIDEAIECGLTHLGVSISDVSIEILDEGAKGLFGLFGSKTARVRLTVKEDMDSISKEPLRVKTGDKPAPKKPAPIKQEPKKESDKVRKADTKPSRPDHPQSVSAECMKAKEFLETLLGYMGVHADIDTQTDSEGNILINMVGDSLGILIGRRGETLDALQYLTSLCVNRNRDDYVRVTLDTENYRAKREEALTRLANRMASRAVKTGRKVSLEPMNPYERRVIHSSLQSNDQVDTHSEGEEPNRHIVITIKKQA